MTKFMFSSPRVVCERERRVWTILLGSCLCVGTILIEHPLPLNAASTPYAASEFGTDYRLGQLDKVRVKVFAWRASKDEVYEWSALNGEYGVSSSGTISVPLIGEVMAGGTTTTELGRAIGRSLTKRIGLLESPEVSVEITNYRPFYIVGTVERPGEYAFRPQMTVLQALSIAGGPERMQELRSTREIIATVGSLENLRLEKSGLLAKKLRLLAEMSNTAVIDPSLIEPFEMQEPGMGTWLAQENRILDARKSGYDAQIASYSQLVTYLEAELKSAQAQLTSRAAEVALVRDELKTVKVLLSKRLTIETRRIALERNLTQVEGERLRAESGVMRVRQDISRARVAVLELQNKRTQDVTTDLSETEAKLALVTGKLKTNEDLLGEAKGVSLAAYKGERTVGPSYTIVRQRNGVSVEVAASETTPVEPGDTIKIDAAVSGTRALTAGFVSPHGRPDRPDKPHVAAFR